MIVKFIISQSLPLSDVPAGKMFMTDLNDYGPIYMMLDASSLDASEGDYIFYYRLGDTVLEKIEMSKAEETYVYIVKSAKKIVGLKSWNERGPYGPFIHK